MIFSRKGAKSAKKVMKLIRIVFILLIASVSFVSAQTTTKTVTQKTNAAKSSPAYAEVILRKTELVAELENLLIDYTEDFPKVRELRYEIGLLQKDLDKISAVTDVSRLSSALGKLMVRRVELQVDVWTLQKQYTDENSDVKRAKKKVEIYEQAIKEILQ